MKGKPTNLLFYAAGVHDPVRLQRANGIEPLFDKSCRCTGSSRNSAEMESISPVR
jgi:hypothetical protein